ncbi:type II toxin-antitoxin system VapC family toxin [Phenylobacterium sp.]|uniref:type II toxin-antitoxin system VapC family toxin n=1 Tax=Phenylobacterium sp. TaxID=1871053 RepID=UPI0037CA3835
MDLLLDTHVLVWFAAGDARMGQRFLSLLPDAATRLFVSAVTAHEYVDLLARGRFGEGVGLDQLRDLMGFHLLDFPAASWETVQALPDIHRDPVDRMLVAHAITLDLPLATADATLAQYPVRIVW